MLSLNRVRQAFVKARTAQANQVVLKGIGLIATRAPDLIEEQPAVAKYGRERARQFGFART